MNIISQHLKIWGYWQGICNFKTVFLDVEIQVNRKKLKKICVISLFLMLIFVLEVCFQYQNWSPKNIFGREIIWINI